MKTILVEHARGRPVDRYEPFTGTDGERLARFCGIDHPEFLDLFERYALMHGNRVGAADGRTAPLPAPGDRESLLRGAFSGRRIVIIGAIAATAFDVSWFKFSFRPHWGGQFAWAPIPSVSARFDPINAALARNFWRDLAKEGK